MCKQINYLTNAQQYWFLGQSALGNLILTAQKFMHIPNGLLHSISVCWEPESLTVIRVILDTIETYHQ